MKKYWIANIVFLFCLLMGIVVVRSAQAIDEKSAINPTDYIRKLTEAPSRKLTGVSENRLIPNPTDLAERKQRLSDQKRKICEEKSKNILKRSTQLGALVENMEKKFTAIVNGVKEYYLKKGLSLSNYAELIAVIEAKKSAIAPLVETTKADVTAFSCTGENPAEQLKKYKIDMEAVLTALHAYRTSIKDLIVAIKGLHIVDVEP